MKETLRLNIPEPCSEDWEKMLPGERGRHCHQCCKTVVDFTAMSDAEVLRYFKENVGAKVCGRLMSDQLERELAPAPVQRNGWKGWNLVLASALVLGKGPEKARPMKAGVEARRVDTVGVDTTRLEMMGGIDSKVMFTDPVIRDGDVIVVPDTAIIPMMGEPRVNDSDSMMSPDTVRVIEPHKEYATTGAVVLVGDTVLCTRKAGKDSVSNVVDSVGAWMKGVMDSVKASVDSFGLLGTTAPKEMVTVYPNPVLRGGLIRLAWRGEAGTYSVAFLNLNGQITQERVIEVAGQGQVDEWAVPDGLAAGVYFLRVARPGAKGVTKEIIIE
jgi:hypothetical protein